MRNVGRRCLVQNFFILLKRRRSRALETIAACSSRTQTKQSRLAPRTKYGEYSGTMTCRICHLITANQVSRAGADEASALQRRAQDRGSCAPGKQTQSDDESQTGRIFSAIQSTFDDPARSTEENWLLMMTTLYYLLLNQ